MLQAHRLVLAMTSSVFEAMLSGPMAEKDELSLPEDPPEAFDWLMKYMYCDDTELPSVEIACQVYHLANKYKLNHLMPKCSRVSLSHFNQHAR